MMAVVPSDALKYKESQVRCSLVDVFTPHSAVLADEGDGTLVWVLCCVHVHCCMCTSYMYTSAKQQSTMRLYEPYISTACWTAGNGNLAILLPSVESRCMTLALMSCHTTSLLYSQFFLATNPRTFKHKC